MKKLLLFMISALVLVSCCDKTDETTTIEKKPQIKNVIYMIGD